MNVICNVGIKTRALLRLLSSLLSSTSLPCHPNIAAGTRREEEGRRVGPWDATLMHDRRGQGSPVVAVAVSPSNIYLCMV
ncbi:MAG: hypothetical protein J3Q66DRAFT_333670 [Benniella sp.]|nr:MAG: hypothetical protein J3Q66DRAFT_333670 [Benniella sp.]